MDIYKIDSDTFDEFYSVVADKPSSFIRLWVKRAWKNPNYGSLPLQEKWDNNFSVAQFWDTSDLPCDVASLIGEWEKLVPPGCHKVFNSDSALDYFEKNYGPDFVDAYKYSYHPSVKADYFRLAYLLKNGGIYADADLRPFGVLPTIDFKTQSFMCCAILCRTPKQNADGSWNWISPDEICTKPYELVDDIAYLNNEIVICEPNNPIIRLAFMKATRNLLFLKRVGKTGNPHVYTGPSVLSAAASTHLISATITKIKSSNLYFIYRGRINETFAVASIDCKYKSDDRGWVAVEKKRGFDLG